jgi:hypothetical protein
VTGLLLSQTAKQVQRSIEKASDSVWVIYKRNQLKATCKIIVQSIDHILGHDLVIEDPHAVAFVTELDRKVHR